MVSTSWAKRTRFPASAAVCPNASASPADCTATTLPSAAIATKATTVPANAQTNSRMSLRWC